MKPIGTTSAGGLLLEINVSEARLLGQLVQALQPLTGESPEPPRLIHIEPAQLPAPAVPPPAAKVGRGRRTRRAHGTFRPGKVSGPGHCKPSRDKTCVVCDHHFHDASLSNKRVTCCAHCKAQRKRQTKSAWLAANAPKAKASARESSRASAPLAREARLAAIRAADQRVLREKDPLAVAGEVARQTASEERT